VIALQLSNDLSSLALLLEGGVFFSLAVAVRIAQRVRRPRRRAGDAPENGK
jgi:hypothetical protein